MNGNQIPHRFYSVSGSKTNVYFNLIKKVTRSKFSHTFIVLGDIYGRQAILEAGARESIINFLDTYYTAPDHFEIYTPKDTSLIEEAIANCLKNYLHVWYSYGQALGVGIVNLNRMLGFSINNPFTKGIICSELSYYYIQQLLQVEEIGDLGKPNNLSPEDIHKWVEASNLFTKTYIKMAGFDPKPFSEAHHD